MTPTSTTSIRGPRRRRVGLGQAGPLVVILIAVALLAVAFFLAACGGGGGSSDAAQSSSQGSSAQSSGIKFASCVRSHGVPNFPDSAVSTNGSGGVSFDVPKGIDPNSTQFKSAMQACRQYLPKGGTGGSGGANTSKMLKFVNCMHTHGVPNFPEPKANGGLKITTGSGIDPNSPQFKSAMQSCRSLLPGGGSGGQVG